MFRSCAQYGRVSIRLEPTELEDRAIHAALGTIFALRVEAGRATTYQADDGVCDES